MERSTGLVCAALLLAACGSSPAGGGGDAGAVGLADGGGDGGSDGGTAGAGDGGSLGAWDLLPATDPLTVTPLLDEAAGVVKAVVEVGSDLLTTTGSDGTRYRLEIPRNALAEPVTIAMTPLTVAGHPFGAGVAHGVQLLPEGLTFNQPLRLTITPPATNPGPAGAPIAFGWSGPSGTVALAMLDPASPAVVLELLHFSSYAFAVATNGVTASLAAVRHRLGGDAAARIDSAIGELLAAAHEAALQGRDPTLVDVDGRLQALLQQYFDTVLQPRIDAAGTSCAAGRLALISALQLARQSQLLGLVVQGLSGMSFEPLVDTAFAQCAEEEWALCRDQHIFQNIVRHYRGLLRQAALLGIDTSVTPKIWEQKLREYVGRCLQFELAAGFTSVQNKQNSTGYFPRQHLQGTIQLKVPMPGGYVPVGTSPSGSSTLSGQDMQVDGSEECSFATPTPRDAQVLAELDWILQSNPKQAGYGQVTDLRLDLGIDPDDAHRWSSYLVSPSGAPPPCSAFTPYSLQAGVGVCFGFAAPFLPPAHGIPGGVNGGVILSGWNPGAPGSFSTAFPMTEAPPRDKAYRVDLNLTVAHNPQ